MSVQSIPNTSDMFPLRKADNNNIPVNHHPPPFCWDSRDARRYQTMHDGKNVHT